MAKELSKYAHPQYIHLIPDYKKIRDCFEGERAIKQAGELYLPKLKAQSIEDYNSYLIRALFFPITGKTCTTMVGLATTKPPKTVYPDLMTRYFVDTASNYQFTETMVSMFMEVTLMGRFGALIDAPVGLGDPTLSTYIAENIVNWELDDQGNLTMLLLREAARVKDGQFASTMEVRFRHCFIRDGVYLVEVLDDDLEVVTGPIAPQFSGESISYIPFVCFGSSGVHLNADKPPMLDIATINISHYLTSADLEWGRHIVGLPTPVVSGVDSSTKVSIGGTAAWILPPAEAKAYYLEFLGQGLQSLEKAMQEKIGLMASMSARLIDNSTRGSEAAETVRLRYMSETASLIHIINSIETGANVLYNMLAKLCKAGGDVSIKFSREILGTGITFKDLAMIFDAYFQGGISKESLLYNLRRLDAVDPNRSDEDEMAAIKEPTLTKPEPIKIADKTPTI
jgi:hypothetical protein